MIPMVDLKRQYNALKSDIDRAIESVLESSHFILGGETVSLEKEIALYHNLGNLPEPECTHKYF